jgi:ubiquinone/menaquinone biosynthesis C-methylase UbiE
MARRTVSDVWKVGHPWSFFYPYAVGHSWIGVPGAYATLATDLRLLYRATDSLGALPKGSLVLDVPCGGGVALRGVRPGQGLHYIAADISTTMLEHTGRTAREQGIADQVELREADVENLPFIDATFDVALSLTGLHCFPDPRLALKEIVRVLKPGGTLILSWMRTDAPLRTYPMFFLGRRGGLVGRSASTTEVVSWLAELGVDHIDLQTSGALAYITAKRSS